MRGKEVKTVFDNNLHNEVATYSNRQSERQSEKRSTIYMSSGISIASVTVSVLPDLTPEITESFWVRIVSASLVDESDREGSLSDSPRPKNSSLEVGEVHIRPNDEFRGILYFTVTLSGGGTYHISESVGLLQLTVNRTSGNFGEVSTFLFTCCVVMQSIVFILTNPFLRIPWMLISKSLAIQYLLII